MDVINLVVSFNLGLLSTPHCLAMCGGIATALGMTKAGGDNPKAEVALHVICYNLGRLTSYMIAGALAGFAGQNLVYAVMPAAGHAVLKILAAVILILIGLHLCEWLPGLRKIEWLGIKFWRLLEPLARRSRTVSGAPGALLSGMVWGWLPCGLVYSVLLWSLSSGRPVSGALIMLAFGAGTLPGMVTAGYLGHELFALLRHRALRTGGGLLLILLGLLFLLVDPTHHQHH